MLKISLWIVSKDKRYLSKAAEILERQHNGIEIIDSAAGEDIAKLAGGDIVLVVGAKEIGMSKIVKVARELNLPEEKLLGDWIVCIPGFTLKKYRTLQHSQLSIVSQNCFGGLLSHMFALPFLSPFVNLWLSSEDYLKFLRAPKFYLEEQLIFKASVPQKTLQFDYPIFTLGDIDIHMNHYPDFDAAVKIWERRKARINRYNLFVTMYTEDEKILEQFDALPYGKKVCFVPFKSDLASAWHVNREIQNDMLFRDIADHFGKGRSFNFDPFDMLLYGKKTPLIDT